jgi:glycosyltransferase involved in cell wall biosynthesis
VSASKIAVIVPAHCEERLIARTIRQIPESVSEIIIVDDASPDGTAQAARDAGDSRVHIVQHRENRGVGAAIYSGYEKALSGSCDFFVVMAGDNQMDGADLPALIAPLAAGSADYVKGNRLLHDKARDMPTLRRWGTRFLARLTSWAAGNHLGDTQCGYTAISRHAASQLAGENLWLRYGYPNDLLILLIHRGLRVLERPVRPVYADEKSGLRPWHLLSIVRVICRRWLIEVRRLPARSASAELRIPGSP